MMDRLFIFGGIAIGALIQLFLPAWPALGGIKPPVLVAFVLYYALRRSSHGMWVAVFWAALLHDGLNLGGVGPALIGFPALAALVHRVRLEIFMDGLMTQLIFGAVGSMLVMLIAVLVYTISGQRTFNFGYALLRIVGSGVLGLVMLPVVSLVMNKLANLFPKRRRYGW